MSAKKPWPRDAVMVVAAVTGEEIREHMRGLYPATCRDCGASVTADTFTVNFAETYPGLPCRPVRFFCTNCVANYDLGTITDLHDHRIHEIKGRPHGG